MNAGHDGGGHKKLRVFAAAVAGLGGLVAVRFALPLGTPRIRGNGSAGSARAVATLEKVRIGGTDQWILARSQDVGNPIVLYLYSCYVGIGQIGNMAAGEAASYAWTLEQARRHNDRRAVEALTRIGPPPYRGDWQRATITQRRYLGRFGGEFHASRNGAFPLVFGGLLFSREYTLADRINYFRGIFGSMKLLWPQLLEVDLFERAPELRIPVFFMEGRYDHECPSVIAERYFEAIRAPSKELIWFERSAHMPNAEERDSFNAVMVGKVLPIAAQHATASSPS